MYINATQLRIGMIFREGESLFRVTYVHHVTPGNKRGFVQSKFRDLKSGIQYDRKFSSEDRGERATLDHQEMEYLYEDGSEFHFMNMETHDQVSLTRDKAGDINHFLTPNQKVTIAFYDEQPVSVELPANVVLKVDRTVRGLRHATATASLKPATLETGITVQVPQFINEGDYVRVDTTTGDYIERAKK